MLRHEKTRTGINPLKIDTIIGRTAKVNIKADKLIKKKYFK